jgi:hypothetical protein
MAASGGAEELAVASEARCLDIGREDSSDCIFRAYQV